jgi:cell division protein FtsI/penicillin-binding protein 2
VPVTLETNAFGLVSGNVQLPISGDRIAWRPDLVFPGLSRGERLIRRTRVPQRAPILARDGTPLAEGSAATRTSPLGTAALDVAGEIGTASPEQVEALARLGFPPGTLTGTSGLELAFDQRLGGRPGGQLLATGAAGGQDAAPRVLASSDPIPGRPVHTTIDPNLQSAAVAALGDAFGGVAALDASDGSVLALAGIAFSGPQPPGSTFKVVTTTAALESGVVKLTDQFPVVTSAVVGGREIANAHDESCGGSFVQAFAHSCNSVFAPLGPKIGSKRLVETAERFGFNSRPSLYDDDAANAVDLPQSTIPTTIGDDLELGVTAIGQGMVQATPLEMASVAQAIANRGVRSPTTLVRDATLKADANPVDVTSPRIAATVRDLMVQVVTSGTGAAATLPGVQVAGKTGTAELGPKALEPGQDPAEAEQKIDAWFTAFAPAGDPKLAAAALVVDASGDGGTVAAPIVREVLAAGLD